MLDWGEGALERPVDRDWSEKCQAWWLPLVSQTQLAFDCENPAMLRFGDAFSWRKESPYQKL